MVTVFDRLERQAWSGVRRLTGEAATIRPMAKAGGPNGALAADLVRSPVGLVGKQVVFDEAIETAEPRNAWDARAVERLRLIKATATLEVELAAIGYALRNDDRVERPANATLYSIVGEVARSNVTVTYGLARLGDLQP